MRSSDSPALSAELRGHIDQLPVLDGPVIPLTDTEVGMASVELNKKRVTIPSGLESQYAEITRIATLGLEPVPDEEDKFVVSKDQLHGIVARAGRAASVETLITVGAALESVREVSALFETDAA